MNCDDDNDDTDDNDDNNGHDNCNDIFLHLLLKEAGEMHILLFVDSDWRLRPSTRCFFSLSEKYLGVNTVSRMMFCLCGSTWDNISCGGSNYPLF
jgi:hypothetical protein